MRQGLANGNVMVVEGNGMVVVNDGNGEVVCVAVRVPHGGEVQETIDCGNQGNHKQDDERFLMLTKKLPFTFEHQITPFK